MFKLCTSRQIYRSHDEDVILMIEKNILKISKEAHMREWPSSNSLFTGSYTTHEIFIGGIEKNVMNFFSPNIMRHHEPFDINISINLEENPQIFHGVFFATK